MRVESLVLGLFLGTAQATTGASTTIWFSKPGSKWTDALPIGNGRLGAVVHGGYAVERVGLNEDKIWRENLVGTGQAVRQYQPAGNMMIEFGHSGDNSSVRAYNRSLDLTTGINQVEYVRRDNNVHYTRKSIASYPHEALGFRYTANSTGALDMKIALTRNEGVTGLKVDLAKKSITMFGQGTNDTSLKFVHQIRILADAGQ
jgi:hypothetical protein